METKVCCRCSIEKSLKSFGSDKRRPNGKGSYCLKCVREKHKIYRLNNPKKRKETVMKSRKNNLETYMEYQKKYEQETNYHKNYRENNKEKTKVYNDTYYNSNKNIILERQSNNRENINLKRREDYSKNPKTKIIAIVRSGIRKFLNGKKNKKTEEILGCTKEFLVEYIESKFQEGMTWNNHGQYGWHIDHIIPLASATTEEDIYKLNHYTNLNPLWWYDNLKKSNKIIF